MAGTGAALVDVLPLALGIAASPFPIIPAILLLFSPRPGAASRAFLAAWFVGVASGVSAFAILAGVIEQPDAPPAWASWTRIALGVALIVLAVRQWVGRRSSKPVPRWMESLQESTATSAARLALVLSVANPKILLLAAAAGLSIGAAELGAGAFAVVLAFSAIGSVTVAIPVVMYAVRGDAILPMLGRARDWLQANNSTVMAVVFAALAVMLLAKGVTSL